MSPSSETDVPGRLASGPSRGPRGVAGRALAATAAGLLFLASTDGWVLAAVAYTVRDDPSACPGEASGAARHGSGGHDDARAAASQTTRTGAPS